VIDSIYVSRILWPVLKTFRQIGKLLGVKLGDGTFRPEVCERDPISLSQRDAVLNQGSRDAVKR
jgi:hypothetical protein